MTENYEPYESHWSPNLSWPCYIPTLVLPYITYSFFKYILTVNYNLDLNESAINVLQHTGWYDIKQKLILSLKQPNLCYKFL